MTTLAAITTLLRRTRRDHNLARDVVYDCGAAHHNMTFSECLANCPSSIQDRYTAARDALNAAEFTAVSEGFCYREASVPSLLFWVKTRHRCGLVSFER